MNNWQITRLPLSPDGALVYIEHKADPDLFLVHLPGFFRHVKGTPENPGYVVSDWSCVPKSQLKDLFEGVEHINGHSSRVQIEENWVATLSRTTCRLLIQ